MPDGKVRAHNRHHSHASTTSGADDQALDHGEPTLTTHEDRNGEEQRQR
jgi:hypothetical protein